jgi:hypothetical protein
MRIARKQYRVRFPISPSYFGQNLTIIFGSHHIFCATPVLIILFNYTRATEGSKRCTQKSEVGRDSARNGSRFFSKKMANATKVLFKYAFAQCFRSYVLLKVFDIYKLFYNF